jgi:hypothetical protein
MTEAEWMECEDPEKMLEFLRWKSSDRKLRLLACACCHTIARLLTDDRICRTIQIAEQFADGLATTKDRRAAKYRAEAVGQEYADDPEYRAYYWAADAAKCTAADSIQGYVRYVGYEVDQALALANSEAANQEKSCRVVHLHDIFGNPFRFLPPLPAVVLAWNDGTVVRLAKGIYDDRRFEDLPILADALEEAGCREQSVLDHLRSPGPHVRGCWPLDLILGRA